MTSTGVSALFNKFYINGVNVDADFNQFDYEQAYSPRPVIHNNSGVHQFKMGIHMPTLKLGGYRVASPNSQQSAWEILRTAGNNLTADIEYMMALELGNGASPAVGDRAILFPGRLSAGLGSGDVKPDDLFSFGPTFAPNGKRTVTADIVAEYTGPSTQTSAFFDSNPSGYTLPTKGGVCGMQIIQGTGAKATGTFSASGTISDGDKFTIGGVDYTAKTALTPTAGEFLIGSSYLVAMQNLYSALTGGYGSGTTYAAGTAVLAAYAAGTVNLTPPGTTGIITITYRTTGTGGNAYTLAKTGTNFAVSGATLASGLAGETATVTVKSATTSGGSYTTFGTFVTTNGQQGAEWLEIAPGTTINRYIEVTVTMSGSSNVAIIHFYFARYWIN